MDKSVSFVLLVMSKVIVLRTLSFILLIVWMLLIFGFSSQNSENSSNTSGTVVSVIIKVACPQYATLSSEAQASLTDSVTFAVRKTAHFLEYFILGLLSFFAAITFNKFKLIVRAVAACTVSVLYAVIDEIHQYFVPGRACRFGDMLIDGAGSLLAVALITVLICKNKKIRNKLGDIYA